MPAPPSLGVPEAGLITARRLADAGRLKEAAAWCDADLVERGPSCDTYYLLGLVSDAAGNREHAGACYQKAIYLQPEHVEALTHLALMKEGRGDFGAAERLHERARRVESATGRVS
jgi:chemotaxis protein methyltransferase WspC